MTDDPLAARLAAWTRAIEVRPGRDDPEDAQRFVALFNAQYARKIPLSYYRWRFFGDGARGQVMFAEKDGALMGACGYQLRRLDPSGTTTAALMVDMIVAPRHRKVGLVFGSLN